MGTNLKNSRASYVCENNLTVWKVFILFVTMVQRRCGMAIDAKRIAKMKKLVEDAKKTGTITPSEKAFVQYPPEGTWQKDERGKIIIKELHSVSIR